MADARKFIRTPFKVNGVISQSDLTAEFGVNNISLKGALIHCPDIGIINLEEPVDMAIQLTHSDIQIKVNAQIVHHEIRDGISFQGCKFLSIDPESMIHLRRLLELNEIPEEEIEKELSFLKD